MPPPHFIYKLIVHCNANMKRKNGFAKFYFLTLYTMSTRRKFLSQAAKSSAFALLPSTYRQLFSGTRPGADTIIDAVEIIRVTGPFASRPGIDHQYQVQPIHIYDDQRPAPYRDLPDAPETVSDITQAYLRIRTKGGLEGLYGMLEPETVAPILQQLRPFLLGKDALAVSALWDELYRNNRHSRAGHYMMALSAVDNTLWDIRGKYFKTPVYELLGGATRKEVGAYGSCLSFTVEKGKIAPRAKALFAQGFVHQKWFMAYGPADGHAGVRKNVEIVEEVRNALGDDAQIMFDAYQSWDLPFATEWCKAADKYNPYWIEEAFPVNRLESFVQLRRNTTIPLATGEHFYSRWEVLDFLQSGSIQIVQADPEWCGGVSELVKICSLASAYGAKVFPHGHNIHAALHVVASQSPDVCPLVEYLINHMPYKLHFQKDPLQTVNGILQLPVKPGFGIEFDEKKITKKEVLTK
jgi:L-rhamnonate dehydratase